MYKKFYLLLLFGLVQPLVQATAIPGTLDTTFNPKGIQPGTVSTTINNLTAYYQYAMQTGLVLQDDNKIIISGTGFDGSAHYFAVARFNSDGSLDTTFNAAGAQPGTASIPLINSSGNSYCLSATLQKDGKILIAGYASDGDASNFTVARFTTDGILDTTFNASGARSNIPGVAMQLISGTGNSYGYSVAVQPNGKIVMGGYASIGNNLFAVAQFNSDGSPDTSFNPSGSQPGTAVGPLINGTDSTGYAMALQSDGKIVVVGSASDTSNPNTFAVIRFNSDGTLDTSFNATGITSNQPGVAVTAITGYDRYNYAYGVSIKKNGNIVVIGSMADSYGIGVAQFNPDGTLDTSFNEAGIQPGTEQIFINNSLFNYSNGFGSAIQHDGKILIAGFGFIPPQSQLFTKFALVRLNTNGAVDNTFNPTSIQPGNVTTDINNWTNGASGFSVAVQKDGAILVGGVASPDGNNYYFSLARFNGVNTTDPLALALINKYSSAVN